MSASSLLFAAPMEEPFADTMEMASPFGGNVDDFDIDIDIMDDQSANADNDFDLQDASPSPGDATGEALHDADMMDDLPEVTVTDASHHETQPSVQNNNAYFTNQETYESEMVDEEEYAEHSDVPITDTEVPAAEIALGENATSDLDKPADEQEQNIKTGMANDSKTEEHREEIPDVAEALETQHGTTQNEPLAEEHSIEHQQGKPDGALEVLEEPQHGVPDITSAEKGDGPHPSNTSETAANAAHQVQEEDQSHETAPQDVGEKEAKNVTDTSAHLHSVKVLYQENEISMFPPREGDASETYFLENEGLAYESVDHLFKGCRAILGEHISDSDSLIFDIESLGLQLSEDNNQNPTVTLSQLVDVYVRLCRNEGVENPEPLYLTLTTRPSLSAEVSSLLDAAAEGKGISDIQTWEGEYDQHDNDQQDTENAEDGEHSLPFESHAEPHEDVKHGEHAYDEAPVSSASAQQPFDESEEQSHEDAESEEAVTNLPNQAVSASTDSTDTKEHPTKDQDALNNGADGHEAVAFEEHDNTQYDFDRHSDSSETVTQAALVQSEDQQPEDPGSQPQLNDAEHGEPKDVKNENLPSDEKLVDNADGATRDNDEVDDHFAPSTSLNHDEADPDDDLQSNDLQVNINEATEEVAGEQNDATEVHEDYVAEDEYEEDAGEEEDDQEVNEEYYEDDEYHEEEHHDANDESTVQPSPVDDSDAKHQDGSIRSNEANTNPLDVSDENDGLLNEPLAATETSESEHAAHNKSTGLTAELTDDLLGLDEDVFAGPEDGARQADETEYPAAGGQDDTNEDDVDEIDLGEFDNADASEVGDNEAATGVDSTTTGLQRQNSSTGKRSRASEDEEIGFVEMSTPDAKRTRSS